MLLHFTGMVNYNEKNYKIEMKNNKIILLDEVKDDKLKQKIENFKFGQYANLKEFRKYNNGDVSINENVPSYDVEYKMSNKDEIVKEFKVVIIFRLKNHLY